MSVLSDISRKQLERISEQERVQIVIVHESDSALVFREETKKVETLVPEIVEGQPLSTSAYQVLMVMTFFQQRDLVERVKQIIDEEHMEKNGS
jgi:transcriptional regulator with PAS, ATPase and Fis domain